MFVDAKETGMMKATYKGVEYFVISTFAEMIELAPTQHGTGSFMVHIDNCVFV